MSPARMLLVLPIGLLIHPLVAHAGDPCASFHCSEGSLCHPTSAGTATCCEMGSVPDPARGDACFPGPARSKWLEGEAQSRTGAVLLGSGSALFIPGAITLGLLLNPDPPAEHCDASGYCSTVTPLPSFNPMFIVSPILLGIGGTMMVVGSGLIIAGALNKGHSHDLPVVPEIGFHEQQVSRSLRISRNLATSGLALLGISLTLAALSTVGAAEEMKPGWSDWGYEMTVVTIPLWMSTFAVSMPLLLSSGYKTANVTGMGGKVARGFGWASWVVGTSLIPLAFFYGMGLGIALGFYGLSAILGIVESIRTLQWIGEAVVIPDQKATAIQPFVAPAHGGATLGVVGWF